MGERDRRKAGEIMRPGGERGERREGKKEEGILVLSLCRFGSETGLVLPPFL